MEIDAVRKVLKHSPEYRVNLPSISKPPAIVQNGSMVADINRDFVPDCFETSGVGGFF